MAQSESTLLHVRREFDIKRYPEKFYVELGVSESGIENNFYWEKE